MRERERERVSEASVSETAVPCTGCTPRTFESYRTLRSSKSYFGRYLFPKLPAAGQVRSCIALCARPC